MAADSTPQTLGLQDHGRAWRHWKWYLLAVLAPVLIVMADAVLRARQADHQAVLWLEALDLSAVALYPSGTPQRHPETLWPGMEIRFSPWLSVPPQKEFKAMDRTPIVRTRLP